MIAFRDEKSEDIKALLCVLFLCRVITFISVVCSWRNFMIRYPNTHRGSDAQREEDNHQNSLYCAHQPWQCEFEGTRPHSCKFSLTSLCNCLGQQGLPTSENRSVNEIRSPGRHRSNKLRTPITAIKANWAFFCFSGNYDKWPRAFLQNSAFSLSTLIQLIKFFIPPVGALVLSFSPSLFPFPLICKRRLFLVYFT